MNLVKLNLMPRSSSPMCSLHTHGICTAYNFVSRLCIEAYTREIAVTQQHTAATYKCAATTQHISTSQEESVRMKN